MAEMLEFNNIFQEVKGSMKEGILRLNDQGIIFSNCKMGKVDNIEAWKLTEGIWRRVAQGHGLKLLTRNGRVYKYNGFQESEFQKLSNFFKTHYHLELTKKDLCMKGWNWGKVKFGGQLLSFDIDDQPAFEIPLSNVSQCTTSKNEVTLEFHQNDDTEVSLVEMRFYVPPTQEEGVDPVEAFAQNVLSKADVIQATVDAICVFHELQCLTPRGRHDIRMYLTFLHLHGKTFDYKIPYSTVLHLFLLPHKDQRQMFFVISLDPPIKQGQTHYHFLILLFSKDDDISLTLNLNEELEKRFEGQLTKNMLGSLYEVVSQIMKALVNCKITIPGNFRGYLGDPCITCSYKASSGLLYPLDQGFIYIHKPPIHIRFPEITFVNFARGITTTRFFDLEIETEQGTWYTFSSIQKEEYGKLLDFISAKNINVKNQGLKEGKNLSYHRYADSDEDRRHNAYLEKMKEEGKSREENASGSSDDSGEEMDESFNPGEEEEDVAEEFDSNASSSPSSNEGDSDREEKEQKQLKKAKMAKDHKDHKKTVKVKKGKDPRAPKKPTSAYLLWLNASQEKIKSDHPGISVTDLSKKAGEIWEGMPKKMQEEWDPKAAGIRRKHENAMKEYERNLGKSSKKDKSKKKKVKAKMDKKSIPSRGSSSKSSSGQLSKGFKSKEFMFRREQKWKEEVAE